MRTVTGCLLALVLSHLAAAQTPRLTEVAERVAAHINSGDCEALEAEFNESMRQAVPLEQMQEFCKAMTVQYGNIRKLEIGQPMPPNAAVFLVHFERGLLDMTIVLDSQDLIAGLLFLPHPPSIPLKDKHESKLHLPVNGRWLVVWGGDTADLNQHHHVPNQKFAFDLIGVGEDGETQKSDGAKNEDYYAFGREILAPGDGIVTDVIEGVRDNVPGSLNPYSALGNAVFIEHCEGEISVLAHLKMGSVRVKVGDRVEAAQVIGLCGNSGNSSEPHLHYHIQNTPIIQDGTGIKIYFEKAVVTHAGKTETKQRYSPIKNDVVSRE